MQSILQYRRFRSTVQAQVERDRAKATGVEKSARNEQPDVSYSASSDDSKDLEKGDSSPEGPSESDLTPNGINPGEANADLAAPPGPPREEVETMQQALRPEDSRDPAREEEEEEQEEDDIDGDHELTQNALSRSSTRTNKSVGTALGAALTGINIRKRSTREGGEGNVFVVGYEGPDDPNNPKNWSNTTRIAATFLVASIGAVVGIASAIDSSALPQAAAEFGVSEVVESMATGLYLVGFGVGALFAGPISETVGRNPVYIVTLGLYMIFIMASALAPNIGAQLAFRFLAGFFGSTPLTCAGGSLSDLWSPMERTFAFPVFANAAFTGPLVGPVMGGFIAQSSLLSWRWVDWITLIISGLVTGLVILFQPETYPPTLLKWKAQHLREITGDMRYKAEIEVREESLAHRLKRALYRPFLLTFREPIIMLVALYLTVIYIVLFTFLDGYTYIFTDIHGTSQGITGLCFLGIILGLFGASALVPIVYKWAKRDLAKIQEQGGDRLPPEFRLWFSMLGGSFALPISLFWMGWTSDPNISIWSPLAASVLFGYGILCVRTTSETAWHVSSYADFSRFSSPVTNTSSTATKFTLRVPWHRSRSSDTLLLEA